MGCFGLGGKEWVEEGLVADSTGWLSSTVRTLSPSDLNAAARALDKIVSFSAM
jgi:hypothetical protein